MNTAPHRARPGQRYNADAAAEAYQRVIGWFGRYLS